MKGPKVMRPVWLSNKPWARGRAGAGLARTLATMHGSSYAGDGARALRDLARAMSEVLAGAGGDSGPRAEFGRPLNRLSKCGKTAP